MPELHPFGRSRKSAVTPAAVGRCICHLVSLAVLVGSVSLQAQVKQQLTLSTAREVHTLSPALATHAHAHLVGVVSYYDAAEHNLFVQDASGGVYIETTRPYALSAGDLISVDGDTYPSYRTEIAPDPLIKVLGKGPRIRAPFTTYKDLATGDQDSQLVTVRGIVRSVNFEQHEAAPILHLDLLMPGGEIEVYQPASALQDGTGTVFSKTGEPLLLDSEVEITGVAGGAFDTKTQLTGIIVYAQRTSAIRVLKPASVSPLALPLTDIDQLFRSRNVEDRSERVRVRGVLTFYRGGDSAVLEQEGKSVFIQTRETKPLALGTVVDAIGFASDQEYAPSLRQAELFSSGQSGSIAPRETTFDEAMSGLYSDDLVAVTGLLVSQLHTATLDTIAINVDGHLVTGRLVRAGFLPQSRIGAEVRLVGICRIVPGGPYRAPILFHIEMRSPSDVEVLSTPSWFTVRHLLGLISVLSVLAFAIAGWAMLLRHRVRQQTERIERSMLIAKHRSALIERISSSQPLSALLPLICQCASELLPNTTCTWLQSPFPSTPVTPASTAPNSGWETFHQVDLFGVENTSVGNLTLAGPVAVSGLEQNQRAEVVTMITEVAQLAIEHCQLYEGLIHHSTHDPLTDLPNRRHCEERLRLALSQAEANFECVAVIYIDINRFKQVNDRFGHRIGDAYLRAIGSRLQEKLRPSDTLARIGGDEFLVIAPGLSGSENARLLIERLRECFQQTFNLEGRSFEGSASFGLACYPEDGSGSEELKRHADHAMYLAKRSSGMEGITTQTLNIITPDELEAALTREQFRLAYQPQFSVDGRLTGLEALLRLEDPILGMLSPDAFIDTAERSELIAPLGLWVLHSALADAVRWDLHHGPRVLLGINVAVQQLLKPDFADSVASVLRQTGFPAERLELELTERTMAAYSDEVATQLVQLRNLGVRISLDDFGTGHSSLSALHRMPIDTIKIDRAFVRAIETETTVLPVIRAITYMAQCLDKRIVAEGVETIASMETLLRLGDMEFQGYLLSKPVLGEDVEAHLELWRKGLTLPRTHS